MSDNPYLSPEPYESSTNKTLNKTKNPYLEDSPIPTTNLEPNFSNQNLEVGNYSANDLVEDRFYIPIRNYMELRFGIGPERNFTRKELVNRYLNNMRGFVGGNTVRAFNELSFLNSLDVEKPADKEAMNVAGQAYTIFEGMETLFGDTDVGEKMSILGDYIRESVLDPVNLIGFGVGKFFASGATKVATRVAQKEAMKQFRKSLTKQGVSRKTATKAQLETAKKESAEVWASAMRSAERKTTNMAVKNRAAKMGKKGYEAFAKKQLLKEVGGNVLVDGVASAGTALAYENGLVRATGREANYEYATGMAVLGTLIFGGSQGLLAAKASKLGGRPKVSSKDEPELTKDGLKVSKKNYNFTDKFGTEDLALPTADVLAPEPLKLSESIRGGASIMDSLKRHIDENGSTESWRKSVSAGKDLRLGDYGDTLVREFIIGNDEKNLVGLVHVMLDQGFSIRERFEGDTVSNFLKDVVKTADPSDFKKFIKDFQKATGFTVYTSAETGKKKKLSTFTPEDFGNVIAEWASRAGLEFKALSDAKKMLDPEKIPENITYKDYADSLFDVGLDQRNAEDTVSILGIPKGSLFGGKLDDTFGAIGSVIPKKETIEAGQNKIIRLLVSAPSTSYPNLVGWGAATGLNSATDIGMAITFLGRSAGQKMKNFIGNKTMQQRLLNNKNAAESYRIAGAYFRSQRQKLRNMLDPNMTYDAFRSIAAKDPDLLKTLTRVIPGGVEDTDLLVKQMGFNPNQTVVGNYTDDLVEFAQAIGLVKMQDVFTKSQEFVHQLDKNLRLSFNKSWSEFFTDKDASKLMNTRQYKLAVARASEETQRAIFSLSFKNRETTLGEFAGLVEDARKVPGLGLLVPFGRFFNNTVAFMSDASALSLISKPFRTEEKRTAKELAIRGAIGWGLAYSLAQDEAIYKEQGLGPFDKPDHLKLPLLGIIKEGTGATIDEKFNFPTSHFKAAGRVWSYAFNGQRMPDGEAAEIIDTVGLDQLTRQLNKTVDGFGNATRKVLTGDMSLIDAGVKALGGIPSQMFSGATRFLDPYNSAFGLMRGENYRITNRKEGVYLRRMAMDSTRYMDQFIDTLMGKGDPDRISDIIGRARNQFTKNVGVREVKMTNLSKILNIIGKRDFLANIDSKAVRANNKFNDIFFDIAEYRARQLLQTKSFQEGDYLGLKTSEKDILKHREGLVTRMFKEVRETVHASMESGIERISNKTNLELAAMGKLMKLERKYKKEGGINFLIKTYNFLVERGDIQRKKVPLAMSDKEAGQQNLENANLTQLDILEAHIDYNRTMDKVYQGAIN